MKNNTTKQCIHHLLETQAQRNPEATVIAAPGRAPLTYERLRIHVSEVVKLFNKMGIGRNDRVAIVLPNGPEMAVAFLAVTAAATSAPLNPAYRDREFDFYLSDLNAKALIISFEMESSARTVAQRRNIPIIELIPQLEAEAGLFRLLGSEYPPAANGGFAQPDDIALVLHTSGTTSRPKIVPLTQVNLWTTAHNIQSSVELDENDRCLNVMPLYHIHGLSTVFSSLAAGGSVVCPPGFDSSKFFAWVETFHPTWYSAAPTIHQQVLAEARDNREIIKQYPLRFIRSASSAMPPQVIREMESIFGVPFIESYGMTEASPTITSNPLPPGKRKIGSAGPAAGPEVAIMNEIGNLLPSNEIGEIVIRGKNVTAGYENNLEANERAFTNGWFRTGDQGYLDGEGYLYITGRIKEIINRGGEKISPREVDEVLMNHPAVSHAVTFAMPHPTLGEDVAAAVVLKSDKAQGVTERDIRQFAFTQLATHKVPSRVVIVEEIPLGPTAKLQRIGLAEKLAMLLKTEYVTPRDSIEKALVQIWAEVLGRDRIGIYDNFFNLGGDSLLATQIVSRIHNAFQVELPLRSLFETPTITELAATITQRKAEQVDSETLTQILAELDQLSTDQVEVLLAAESLMKEDGND